MKPEWLSKAIKYLGTKEIPGKGDNPEILGFHETAGGALPDETPWCSSFVNACMESVGIKGTGSKVARSWLNWGIKTEPRPGCVVVFQRGTGWQGHVGFLLGVSPAGNLIVLGGNQGNSVSVTLYSRDQVLGYRWPA